MQMARHEELAYIDHLLQTNEPISAVDYMVSSGGTHRFPLALLERLHEAVNPTKPAVKSTIPRGKPRSLVDVCVVEDDCAIQEVVNGVLEDADINVDACPVGWKAHAHIRRNCPKLVILDVHMPTVDGIQLFYLLRADPKTQAIPVIFLTAHPQRVRRELPNFEELGAVLLPKPFMIDELLELVQVELAA